MKWNFLYHITAASRIPDKEATTPQIRILSVLCPQLNLLKTPNKISGYATGKLILKLEATSKLSINQINNKT